MATIREVAKRAGVSVATVSNAITENRSVNAETRARVLRAAKELNYKPNLMASSMVTKKTNIIGIFFYNFAEKNFLPYSEFLKGVTLTCQRRGQRVLVYTDVTEEQFHEGFILGNEPIDAGIIFFPQEDEFRANDLKYASLPFVFVGKCRGFSFVDCENKKLTYRLTKKLIDAGNRKICFFNSDPNWMLTKDRRAGFYAALDEAKIERKQCAEYNENYENCEIFLADAFERGFRAFVVESPRMVRAIYERCLRDGLRIGKDVSVVFLGYDPQFDLMTPSLTCAKLSYEELGQSAVELIERVKKINVPQEVYLEASVIAGNSIARMG